MLKLVEEQNVKAFMKKHGISESDAGYCLKCKKEVIFNEHFYIKGYACVRYNHDCPENYWVTRLVPISNEEISFWKVTIEDK